MKLFLEVIEGQCVSIQIVLAFNVVGRAVGRVMLPGKLYPRNKHREIVLI